MNLVLISLSWINRVHDQSIGLATMMQVYITKFMAILTHCLRLAH